MLCVREGVVKKPPLMRGWFKKSTKNRLQQFLWESFSEMEPWDCEPPSHHLLHHQTNNKHIKELIHAMIRFKPTHRAKDFHFIPFHPRYGII